jgi:hypothetical protein
LLWQATNLFVIAALQNGLYPCTYRTRRLDSLFVGTCAPVRRPDGHASGDLFGWRFIESDQ